jgi:hypothetical protein
MNKGFYKMGFLLFLLALIVVPIISVFGLLYFVFSFTKQGFLNFVAQLNRMFYFMAHSLDRFANVACQKALHDLMLEKGVEEYHAFGDGDETVSAVLGANLVKGTLSGNGLWWVKFLDKVDFLHCQLAMLSEICKIKMVAKQLKAMLEENPNFLIECLERNEQASNLKTY